MTVTRKRSVRTCQRTWRQSGGGAPIGRPRPGSADGGAKCLKYQMTIQARACVTQGAEMDNQTDRRSFLLRTGVSALAVGAAALQAQTEKPIRLAIIGSGLRGWAHLAILKTLPQFEEVAVAD